MPTGSSQNKLPGGGVYNSKNLALFVYSYQSPIIMLDPDGNRPASYDEISTMMDFFGASIEYNDIDIQTASGARPHFSGNTIYVTATMGGSEHDQSTPFEGHNYQGKFLHEVEHVRQYQHGEYVKTKAFFPQSKAWLKGGIKGLFTAAFSDKTVGQIQDDTIARDVYDSYVNEPIKPFEKYTVEQRGQIVEDTANAHYRGVTVGSKEVRAQEILNADPGALER